MGDRLRIAAVIVAYNRAPLLAECLDALAAQSRPLDAIVVIDNASTDTSAQVAVKHPAVTECVRMPENLGGAGGFAAGIARAVSRYQPNLVWVMDDDTVPEPNALAELLRARSEYPGTPALLAAKAVWTDGREHPMNRPRVRPLISVKQRRKAEAIASVPIRTASFVAVLIDVRAIRAEGLPEAAYFLWNDDFEYSSRILRSRVGLYVPAAVVTHKTAKFGNAGVNPGERFVNEVRNKVWMFRFSRGLRPLEKILYGGKTLLRWSGLLAGAEKPLELLKYGLDGLRQARNHPEPTAEILARTPVAGDVAKLKGNCQDCADFSRYETTEIQPFTVLMSVYAGDDPQYFRAALRSVTADQTLKPDQVVLVVDGPLDGELQREVAAAEELAGQPIEVHRLPENRGLAEALDFGIGFARNELIARADADDISMPQRFATQIPLMRDLDLLGTWVREFETSIEQPGLVRRVPLLPSDIRRVARMRDPFNHPTVVFRGLTVLSVGGYAGGDSMEDYWLFTRMLQAGARVANLPDALVFYRIGAGAYKRRGGLSMAATELRMQNKMLASGFINPLQYLRNLLIRVPYRLIPTRWRRAAYAAIGERIWFKEGQK
ncbi:MAG: glycosyltransferase [Varibaculum sp.]|nr:glycosyltransferase [Varibaculum sp.]